MWVCTHQESRHDKNKCLYFQKDMHMWLSDVFSWCFSYCEAWNKNCHSNKYFKIDCFITKRERITRAWTTPQRPHPWWVQGSEQIYGNTDISHHPYSSHPTLVRHTISSSVQPTYLTPILVAREAPPGWTNQQMMVSEKPISRQYHPSGPWQEPKVASQVTPVADPPK